MPVKESVRMAYLRSLSCMIEFHTGTDLVKRTDILHNREARERVFITDEDFRTAYRASDPSRGWSCAWGHTWASGGWRCSPSATATSTAAS